MKKYLLALVFASSPLLADMNFCGQMGNMYQIEDSIDMNKSKKDKKKNKNKNKNKLKAANANRAEPEIMPIADQSLLEVTDETLDEVLRQNTDVVVDFYAPWCGPCKNLAPILVQISQENKDVVIVKLNGDKYRAIMDKYNVKAFPTLLKFRGGEEVDRSVGSVSKAQLISFISKQ